MTEISRVDFVLSVVSVFRVGVKKGSEEGTGQGPRKPMSMSGRVFVSISGTQVQPEAKGFLLASESSR